jgi:hypothetical protein
MLQCSYFPDSSVRLPNDAAPIGMCGDPPDGVGRHQVLRPPALQRNSHKIVPLRRGGVQAVVQDGLRHSSTVGTEVDSLRATTRFANPSGKQAIESVSLIGGRLVAQHLVDVQSRVSLFGLDGAPEGDIPLPAAGAVLGISGREDTPEIFYAFSSPLYPQTVFVYDRRSRQQLRSERLSLRLMSSSTKPGALRDFQRRDARPVFPHLEERLGPGWQPPCNAVRLRRVFH